MTQGDKTRRAPRGWAWYISRAQAIAEYDLIDVSEQAHETGIACPVALTSLSWHDCVRVESRDPAVETQRLRHLLDWLREALPPLDGQWERVNFSVEVADVRPGTTRVFCLEAFAGTGDDGEPVINLKRPCERYFWEEHLPLAQRIHDALAANERPDDEGIVACLLETPEHHAALRHAVQVAVERGLPCGFGFSGDDDMKDATTKPEELLVCCPLCGGEIQATIERYYSLRGGAWIESGVDGDSRLYCENDCDLSEYAGRIPPIG